MIEFASGTGRILRMLNEAGYRCVGIDLSLEMSSYANKAVSLSSDIITADMLSTPLRTECFAAALNTLSSISCLAGMNSIRGHLSEACRVLWRDGIYVVDFLLGVPRKRMELWEIERGRERYDVRWEILAVSRRGDKFVEEIEVRRGSDVLHSKAQTSIIRAEDFCLAVSKAGFEVVSWFRPFRERQLHYPPTRGRVIAVLRKKS